jgi:WD40 repeat protein
MSMRLCRPLWIALVTVVLVVVPAVGAEVPWVEVARWKRSSAPTMVAISRDGKMIAADDGKGRILLWDKSKKQVVRSFFSEYAQSLQFSSDGRFLATTDGRSLRLSQVSLSGSVHLRSAETGALLHESTFDWGVNAAAFTADGKQIVVALHNSVAVFDVPTGEHLKTTSQRDSVPNSITRSVFAANRGEIFSVSGDYIEVWQPDSLKWKRTIYSGRQFSVVAVAPNADRYATCKTYSAENQAGAITIVETWDIKKNLRYNRSELAGSHQNILYSPDGSFLLAVGDSREVHLWDAQTLDYKGKLDEACGPVGFSVDGSFLAATTTSGDIGVWHRREKD